MLYPDNPTFLPFPLQRAGEIRHVAQQRLLHITLHKTPFVLHDMKTPFAIMRKECDAVFNFHLN
jgi:hypothetical protein